MATENKDVLEEELAKLQVEGGESLTWTKRHAVEGVQIFGGIGSGKTTGSGRFLAIKYLRAGFGGLVLTVKPEERKEWEHYCELTGRKDDLIVIRPGGDQRFNFLDYECRQEESLTDNIVQVLKTVIRAGEVKANGKGEDPFWENALDMLIFHVIDLCLLAYGRVTVDMMYDIVQTLPHPEKKAVPDDVNAFRRAYKTADDKCNAQIDDWFKTRDQEKMFALLKNQADFEQAACEALPDVRLFRNVAQFFNETFRQLAEKTRTTIDFSFSGFLFRLLRDPVYSLFCEGASTVFPEHSLMKKIILIDLPVKLYHKVGRDCQIMFKFIWQRAMEKRNVSEQTQPVFLWADEAQHFLHEHDADFQATARSSRVATVYISQNLPNYYACMGGDKSGFRVKSFLGTLNTKIFHANADIETNQYASNLIGENEFEKQSESISTAQQYNQTYSYGMEFKRIVRPEVFPKLVTGAAHNNYLVAAYMHLQGTVTSFGHNHILTMFSQKFGEPTKTAKQ